MHCIQAVDLPCIGKCGDYQEPIAAGDVVEEGAIKDTAAGELESTKAATKEESDGSENESGNSKSKSSDSDDAEGTPEDSPFDGIFEYRRTPPTILYVWYTSLSADLLNAMVDASDRAQLPLHKASLAHCGSSHWKQQYTR